MDKDNDSYLNLPSDPGKDKDEPPNPAADLIRKKVEAAYASEPNASAEVAKVKGAAPSGHLSKHQKFIYELTSSGKSLEEIQVEWHDYYASLSDVEKHRVWQEFYSTHGSSTASILAPAKSQAEDGTLPKVNALNTASSKLRSLKEFIVGNAPLHKQTEPKKPVHSLFFGLGVGAIVIFVVLFSFFNERFIAPFIQPSRSLSNVPLISEGGVVRPNPEVIIPKINVEIPVVYGLNTISDNAIDNALESGVVHYADTAEPGQNGNAVIVGHSSNNIFNKGKYKFAFVLLSRMELGDTFYLQKDGKRYTYQIYQKKIVKPTDVSVLGTADKPATATLITCDPPGTSINRLVVVGEQINPDPASNSPQSTDNSLATQTKVVPGNSRSLWSRLTGWLSN